jgi:hypothetical protein
MRWLQGQLTWCGRESLHRTSENASCEDAVKFCQSASRSRALQKLTSIEADEEALRVADLVCALIAA